MKYKYMHTVRGRPAIYDRKEQICYVIKVGELVSTLKQIKEEQKASDKWRLKKGFKSSFEEYGYIRVKID